jgi:hypothetical protein
MHSRADFLVALLAITSGVVIVTLREHSPATLQLVVENIPFFRRRVNNLDVPSASMLLLIAMTYLRAAALGGPPSLKLWVQPGEDHVGEDARHGFGFQVAYSDGRLAAASPGSKAGHVDVIPTTTDDENAGRPQRVPGWNAGDQAGVGLVMSLDGSTIALGAPMHAA